jgi:nucleotide-binding universal stress UspA family protein
MATIQRVLAATDLSAPARHAADRAASLARTLGATLDLVHVAQMPPLEWLARLVDDLPADLPQRWLGDAETALHALAAALQRRHGIDAGVHLASGALLAEIARVAEATSADLIVLGARGSSFVRHLVLGSTAERLVSTATRPMLVVKQIAHAPYASVLVPVDFSPASPAALRCAGAVAPGARLRALHAFEAPFEGKLRNAGVRERVLREYRTRAERDARERMAALRVESGPMRGGGSALILHGGAVVRILEQEQEDDCDLIAVGKHSESRLADFFLGSVTRRVLAESQADVLVVPVPAPAGAE